MSKVSKDLCLRFAEARRAKGFRQTELAARIGCTQSALSMFEGGNPTKLSEETVKKLSEVLEVSLNEESSAANGEPARAWRESASITHGFCPNGQCPSNVPYVVDGRLFYRPSRKVASPTGGMRCTQCGEILEMCCPKCGASLNDGACCAVCGAAYVTPSLEEGADMAVYARVRRAEIIQLRELA